MTETSQWLHRAAALQRFVGYDIPLDRLTLTATHNSFSSDRDISTHANFEVVTAQVFGITDQLSCLGVRGLELDLHYIEELAEEGDEDSAIRLCHASEDVAEQISELCATFGWDICEDADIFDYGEDTGCRSGAPTARDGFTEVSDWLSLEENANEVVFIKLDSTLNDEDERVSTIATEVFGEGAIFSPASWEEFSGSSDWPSPAELVALGTRVVIAGSEPSSLVFSTDTDAVEVITSAQNFEPNSCDEVDDFPEPPWHRVQGDLVEYRLDRRNSTIFELVPDSDEAVTASMTQNIMNCGFTPTFDRLDAELMESTVWSWATDRPETGFEQPRAAVVSAEGGRWTDVDSDAGSGEIHSYACRNSESDRRFDWVVVPVAGSGSDGGSASSRRQRARRRRRRLATSYYADGGDYDEGDGESDDGDDGDGEVEFSDFSGEFADAEEACESVGYVFGAPRSAYENAILRIQMDESGIDTAWIDHTSQGDELGSSICWTHEDSSEYCVDVPDDTCAAEPEPVTEFAEGQLPDFEIADWEDEDYVRPEYTISATVENLHGWARVAGDNEFDLSERGYVVGIILAAVPVFVFGFIVACCCLPVGHIAAGSKEHHVDGSGFFGCFCPSRCKRGDFMGSGTLGVVVVFTIVTIVGGALAIFGVRSVDGEIVHMVDSLESMGQIMVEAQSGVEVIYGLLGNVQESFEAISSCSLVSSLEGVEAGIISARDAVEVVIEDDELGSVGRDILAVEESFSETATTRRGVVYLAGALVLVMSVIYVGVGYYALRKDEGRGKAGGARMRGPVLIGCIILPLTLLVIMLCWFLFGLSTSVALLTSDFCIDPSDHTTNAFSSPDDQEIVAYYTTCEGPNVFSDQLATAYIQGRAAQGLLDALEDDVFAAECPEEAPSKIALDDDISEILVQINSLGFLVQCSSINPLFVDGVENSICTDAPADIWFVIVGFAIVSVGLFVVAVSFRLLLQQKEEGLYKVVFDDEIESSVASSSDFEGSEDSFTRAHNAAAASGSGKSLGYDGSSKSGGGARVQQSSPESTLPSSTSPTPPRYGGGHGVAAVEVGAWGDPKRTGPKGRPVELAMPLSRAHAGGRDGNGSGGLDPPAFSAPGGGGDLLSSDDGGEAWRRAGREEHASAAAGDGSAAIPRGRSRRSNGSSNGRSGHHHRHHHHHHHHHNDYASQSGKSGPSRLFRTLAGLDDPTEEAPSVIVSRSAVQRSTRNLGGAGGSGRISVSGGDANRHLTVAFGRASSVVGSVSRRHDGDYSSDESSDSFDDDDDDDHHHQGAADGRGKRRARGFSGHSSVESGSATNVVGFSGGGSGKKSGRFSTNGSGVIPAPSGRTWAAFSRDCARQEDAPTLSITDEIQDFRSGSGRTRRSSNGAGAGGSGRERRHASPRSSTDGTVAPGFGGTGGGGGVPDSPESSTVSGLTGWRRQRLQQRVASQRSSRRAARDSGGDSGADARAREGAEGSKHGEGTSRGGKLPGRQGGGGGCGGVSATTGTTTRVSPRSWNKGGRAGGSRPGTATKTGVKSLSALSRTSTAEARTSAGTRSGESRAAAVTGTASGLSSSGRSGSSGGGAASGGSGSSRPGTSLKDALNARRGSGGGGGGDGRRQW